jgi:CheY-specific phosphatase CheX
VPGRVTEAADLDQRSLALLDTALEDTTLALFESIGVRLWRASVPPQASDDIAASIGFAGAELRGALVLISSRRLVHQALPREVADREADEQLADWMGELTNQLLGRVKNRLLRYGVALAMGTPTVVFGNALSQKDRHKGLRRRFGFRHADQSLSVCFDAISTPGLSLAVPMTPPAFGILEGDVALF